MRVFFDIIGNIMTIRAVLDTNILVAGLVSQNGASFALLKNAFERRFLMLTSPALWLEYEATLKRPDIAKLHQLSHADVDDVLNGLAEMVTPVRSHFLWRPQLRDPGDELVLEAAVSGMAKYLVTLNVKDFTPTSHHFGIVLWSPAQLLQLVEKNQ